VNSSASNLLCEPQRAPSGQIVAPRKSEFAAEATLVAFARFATGVVHEVNNPLGVALANAQLALRRLPSSAPPQHVQCLERVVESIRTASTAIREMLQVGSYCGVAIEPQVFDIRDVLRFASTAMRGLAESRGCTLAWSVAPESSQMTGNPLEIEILLASLIYRAFDGGARSVVLGSRADGERLEVTIDDNGPVANDEADEADCVCLLNSIVIAHRGELSHSRTEGGGRRTLLSFPRHVTGGFEHEFA
jgi:signal transduction histidine kinase